MGGTIRSLSVCLAVAAVSFAGSVARADYESDKNAQHMGVIERALDKLQPDASIFDGTSIVAGASVAAVRSHHDGCNGTIETWNRYERQVTRKGKATERFRAIVERVRRLSEYCAAFHAVAVPYVEGVAARESAAAAAKADAKRTCDQLRAEAYETLGNHLFHLLDTWAGTRTPGTPAEIGEFRARLDQLAPLCRQPKYAGAVQACRGQGILLSPDTNKRFDHGDLCAPAADPQQTLRDVATRLLELKIRHGSRQPPTPESLRRSQGWIQEEQPIYYKTYFQVTADVKKAMESTIDEAFAAAGVAPPRDLSTIWAHKQAYLDALKTAVDATAGEWKLAQNACRGYACALAKKSIQKGYKGASIKGVYGRDWRISKNNLDIPTHKYMDLWIVFQVRGEPYCQVRSATATEQYAGGGKYQKARGVRWGYARFQTSCR